MGLFGSLFTGVSTLFSQSQKTAIISNNIANVSTTGFKRSEASFNSLVTTESRASTFSPGTVSVNRLQRVDQQGSIQQTSSSTDAAISGNGFFAVKRSTDFGQEFLYTRAGQLSEDAQGLLRNASGFVLYAWPIDTNGDLPANQGDLTSLVPADVAFLGGLTRPTTEAELAINLDADQANYINDDFATPSVLPLPSSQPAHFSRGLTVFDSLGSAQTMTFEFRKVLGPMAHFTTNSGVSLETSNLVAGNGVSSSPGVLSGVNQGDVITIQVGSTSETFEFVNTVGNAVSTPNHEIVTVQDYIDALNAFGGGSVLEARLVGGQIVTQAVSPTANIEITNTTGTAATSAAGFNYVRDVDGYQEVSSGVFSAATDDIVSTLSNVSDLDTLTITVGGTATNITIDDTTANVNLAGTPPIVETVQDLLDVINGNNGAAGITGLSASLGSDGRIIYELADSTSSFSIGGAAGTGGDNNLGFGTTDLLFEPEAPISPTGPSNTYNTNDPYPDQDDFPQISETAAPNTQGWWEVTILDPNNVALTTGLINFNGDGSINASANSDGNTEISLANINWGNGSVPQDIDIDISRFSQFSGNYDVIFSDQNGAELGLRTGVEITRDGTIVARFSNGASADLYKAPLVTFANPNGLTEVSGTAFTESEESGEENLREAGLGGAGFVEPSTLESSNVDLANEFAELIIAQRGFSAGTRVINTVDTMTEELLRLR